MIPTIDIRVADREGIPVATIEGEIDIANASEVRDQLFALLSNRASGLIVDLSGVTYLDSRGVHVMLELAERTKVRHQQLRLVVPERAMIRRVLQLTRLDAVVPLDHTVDDAAAHLGAER